MGDWQTTLLVGETPKLMDEIVVIKERLDEADAATAERVEKFNSRAAVIVNEISTVSRIVSQPVIVGIVNEDYTPTADQQRLSHQSTESGVLTLPPAKNYYTRRSLIVNTSGGDLLVSAQFIRITRDGTNKVVNPVLKAGEAMEFIGLFVADRNGNETAPDNLEIDGDDAPAGTKGYYRLQIVNFDSLSVLWTEYSAKIAEIETKVQQAAARAMVPGPKGDKGETGLQGLPGAKGDTGAAGTNATTTAIATSSANGLMGSGDKAKLDDLYPSLGTKQTPVSVALPLIAVGSSYSFPVTVPGAKTFMTATVNPVTNGTFPSNVSNWKAVVTADNTVTVYLTAGLAIAAGNQQFAVRVIQ